VTGPAGAAADLARSFLTTGIMPKAQSNAEVTVVSPGGVRGPVPNPYDVPTGAVAGDVSTIENITASVADVQNVSIGQLTNTGSSDTTGAIADSSTTAGTSDSNFTHYALIIIGLLSANLLVLLILVVIGVGLYIKRGRTSGGPPRGAQYVPVNFKDAEPLQAEGFEEARRYSD
jgi:hypothetical protein